MKIKIIIYIIFLSLAISSEVGLANAPNNISSFYGLWTTHVAGGSSNNENFIKVAMYDRWVLGHSINSSRNHSFLIGRCLAIKQIYFTQKLFSEFKFNVAIATGYSDFGNIPGPYGLMYGMTGSAGIGFRMKSDLEGILEFLYLPTPDGGVFNIGLSCRKVLPQF
tara:strand:- start:40 stop:534 length:495 start_codon:yes stop_codon:yes gene_type:complete